jgi:deoxyribodipyrimidine photolyase-related protein
MADFYRLQRQERQWLLEADGRPMGGQWSFDAENRRPMPKGRTGPPIPWIEPDATTQEVIQLAAAAFPSHPGRAEDFRWPVDRSGALAWLEDFILQRLPDFGAYEDALSAEEDTLWHSLLSPLINLGLILPGEAVDAAIRALDEGWAPLNSVEGFVRQIGGWREFVRRIDMEYRAAGLRFQGRGEGRRLADCWREGGTGLPPLDAVAGRCQRLGWAHHIERLMVAGSLLMMVEADIDEAYRWFMEMFIDSAEWVMRPNVYGMSLFADGGLLATKPYISGSAYILKMSDYPKGAWCEVWDGLYWRFVHRHRAIFEANPRSRMVLGSLERMEAGRRERIFAAAEEFIERTTLPPEPFPAAR